MFQSESTRNNKYPDRFSGQGNHDEGEVKGTEKVRNVYVMSQGDHKVFYVDVGDMTPDESKFLLDAIKTKYDNNNVAGFIQKENGDWIFI